MGSKKISELNELLPEEIDLTEEFVLAKGLSNKKISLGNLQNCMRTQADWNEIDSSKADYIKNKPSIPLSGLKTSGYNYIIVESGSNATINGANLIAAYGAAKGLSPGGSAITTTNRVSVLI